jgi:hypothetical protein
VRQTVGWLVLGVCTLFTSQQIPVWSSDRALWEQAAQVSPTAPRAAVNVAAALIREGQWALAEAWAGRAERLVRAENRAKERDVVRKILDEQWTWIDAFSSSR